VQKADETAKRSRTRARRQDGLPEYNIQPTTETGTAVSQVPAATEAADRQQPRPPWQRRWEATGRRGTPASWGYSMAEYHLHNNADLLEDCMDNLTRRPTCIYYLPSKPSNLSKVLHNPVVNPCSLIQLVIIQTISSEAMLIMPPPLICGALSDDAVWRLTVCLSCTSGLSREQRPRKTKIGTGIAHVTIDSDTTFKVKRSKVKVTMPLYSPPCWRVRQLQRWKRVGREKLLLRCRLLGAHGKRGGAGAYRGGRPPTACYGAFPA